MRLAQSLSKFPSTHAPVYHPPSLHNHFQGSPILYAQKKLQHINCVIPSNQDQGGIFLGDIICVIKPQILTTNKIQAVISCVDQQVQFIKAIPSQIKVLHIAAQDNLEYLISKDFLKAYQFIEQARKQKKNVLVHCHAGVSRSATILCSYLIIKYKMSPDQALSEIKKTRQRAKPNENFRFQLRLFYQNYILKQKETSEKINNFHSLKPRHKQFFSSQGINEHFQNHINKHQSSQLQSKFTSLEKHQNIRFSDFHAHQMHTPQKSPSNYYANTPNKSVSNHQYTLGQNNVCDRKQSTPSAFNSPVHSPQSPYQESKPSRFNAKSPNTRQVLSRLKQKIENNQNDSSKNVGQNKKRKLFPTKNKLNESKSNQQENIKPNEWRPFNSNKKIQAKKGENEAKNEKEFSFSIHDLSSTVSQLANKLVNSLYNQQTTNRTFQ